MSSPSDQMRFDAVLAKNDIARIVKRLRKDGRRLSASDVTAIECNLEMIEYAVGVANQPSVAGIFGTEDDI